MGFALFESSGTFKPASYGLVVGDTIQVVAVGGGKGGQGATNSESGANGSASSFGSYVTAAGASTLVDIKGITFAIDGGISAAIGSDGEHGWGSALWRMPAWIPGIDIDVFNICSTLPDADALALRNAGATDKAMNGGARVSGRSCTVGGRGGLGYGAGGGGSVYIYGNDRYAAAGGKAGTVKIATITLSSLSTITVTVGAGGAGGGDSLAKGGAGANGCVAVFW